MLLEVLEKAKESIRHSPNEDEVLKKERKRAFEALSYAKRRIEQPSRNVYDLEASVLFSYLDRLERLNVEAVLRSIVPDDPKPTLSSFGKVRWSTVESAFSAAGITCPLALRAFHARYQEGYVIRSNLMKTVTPAPTAEPRK
jgi:hypothetical protein